MGQDIIELAELCKKETVGAFEVPVYPFPSGVFIGAKTNALRLCAIGNVQGINALAPKKPLDFGTGNLAQLCMDR